MAKIVAHKIRGITEIMLYVFNSLNEPSCFQTNIGFYKIYGARISWQTRCLFWHVTYELHSYWVKPIISYTKKIKVGIIFNFFYFVQKKIFSGRNHELTKNQHIRMPRNLLSEIFSYFWCCFRKWKLPLRYAWK